MYQIYKPTWMIDAIYDITPDQLKKLGIKAVLTDLDNTLIAWNNPDGTEELLKWIDAMKQAEIPVIVVSNNKATRVARAVQHLQLDFVSRAMKPFQRGFKIVERRYNLPKESLIMVGDQLMTDIKGANRAGIRTVLVKPIVTSDAWNTKFNRARERRVMRRLIELYPEEMKWRKSLND
ncbi:HAD family hydrolase [Vagococcus penaei]|uniref:HAD family hydrolase n=1 Tax=Vagococcus penaei TaxID=633807 RepID=A0A1Q2D4E2_9ENTE|nr:YqeG family HAD IIIA-type phosphatase [Vagococcus penaei]AQP53252.1 HAD family hydrolase [Vagococcus penaei]RST98699.1 HAD family hydrolase [Vagococcus penaei]